MDSPKLANSPKMTTKHIEMIDKFLKRVFSNPTLSAIKYYLKQRLTNAENSPKLAKRSIMTEYTDDRWITREIPDPENAKPLEVTDQFGNKIGNGFVSPETGKVCIDLHGKNKDTVSHIQAEGKRTIITLCEPVNFEGVKICRKETKK